VELFTIILGCRSSVACFKTRLDKFYLTRMLCMTLKHHSWEPGVEVILSVIVSFYYVQRCGHEATACTHSADTIRYNDCVSVRHG